MAWSIWMNARKFYVAPSFVNIKTSFATTFFIFSKQKNEYSSKLYSVINYRVEPWLLVNRCTYKPISRMQLKFIKFSFYYYLLTSCKYS